MKINQLWCYGMTFRVLVDDSMLVIIEIIVIYLSNSSNN